MYLITVLALLVATTTAAPAPIQSDVSSNDPVSVIVNGVPDNVGIDLSNIVNIELNHAKDDVIETSDVLAALSLPSIVNQETEDVLISPDESNPIEHVEIPSAPVDLFPIQVEHVESPSAPVDLFPIQVEHVESPSAPVDLFPIQIEHVESPSAPVDLFPIQIEHVESPSAPVDLFPIQIEHVESPSAPVDLFPIQIEHVESPSAPVDLFPIQVEHVESPSAPADLFPIQVEHIEAAEQTPLEEEAPIAVESVLEPLDGEVYNNGWVSVTINGASQHIMSHLSSWMSLAMNLFNGEQTESKEII